MATLEWRMTARTYDVYCELYDQIDQATEQTPAWHVALDELRSLPGYPCQATELDEVVPVITTIRR